MPSSRPFWIFEEMCRYERCDYQLISVLKMLTNFFIAHQNGGWAALWAVPKHIFIFWNLSHILSYCYSRLTRDLSCVLGRRCCKTYWLIWNQISTMLLSLYYIVCVHLCYRVSHGYFWLEKGSETTSLPFYAWHLCNRHRRRVN